MTMLLKFFRHPIVFFLVLLLVLARPFPGVTAENTIHLISAENPGGLLEKNGDIIVGAYPDFFHEASARSGVSIDYRIVPWARAVKESERSDNLLLFPFTRTLEREKRFTWIVPLKKEPICFASPGKKINSIGQARLLKRILVWRGSSTQAFLKSLNFDNLIVIASIEKVMQVFKASPDAAWYFTCDQLNIVFDQDDTDGSVKVGTPVASEDIWLVSGKSYVPKSGFDKFVQAIDALRGEKLLDKLLAEAAK